MAFSPELLEALKKFEEMSPMKCVVVSTDDQFDQAVAEMAKLELRLACVSNAGLRHPCRRLTFLPAEAFKKSPEPERVREPVDLREWVKQF